MQDNTAHVEDCHLPGVDADANLVDVERAWRNLQATYDKDAMATYGLLEGPACQEKLKELKGAHGRILKQLSEPSPKSSVSAVANREERLKQLSPNEPIGPFLREVRESLGLTLRDITDRTKVNPRRLEQIEQEMFDLLPEAIYVRGFVLEYAKMLGFLHPKEVAGMYLARFKEQAACL